MQEEDPTEPVRLVRRRVEEAKGTDRGLLVLLALLNLASLYTTVVGARQVLPWPMSDVLGVAVQTMLFLALAGFVGRHAPIRRWIVVAVFAAASVYTSFFAYYEQLAGDALGAANLDRARQAHAAFVDETWEPVLAGVESTERQAAQLLDQAEREGRDGLTTGVVGFGPVARRLAEEARTTELAAAERRADLERMRPRFEVDAQAMAAEELYLFDLETWQAMPDAWKTTAEAPSRAAWLDLDQEVALITPFEKVRDGETPALAALLLALLVDGTSLLLGTAIHARQRPILDTVADRAVALVTDAKTAGAALRDALDRPAEAGGRLDPPGLDPARLVLRVTGRGTDFLGAVYEAIHPETGTLDALRLLEHDDPTWRISARVLLDRLRDPRVGWLKVDGGRWKVQRYDALTAWLAEQYRAACEAEAVEQQAAAESYLQLPVPA